MRKEPIFFENSKVPVWLSKFAPIEISAITLGLVVFARGTLSQRTKRHETIHYYQYLETFIIGFLLIYLFDYLYCAIIKKKGFTRDAYRSIRFEQEAYANDGNEEYLNTRDKYSWINYRLGGS